MAMSSSGSSSGEWSAVNVEDHDTDRVPRTASGNWMSMSGNFVQERVRTGHAHALRWLTQVGGAKLTWSQTFRDPLLEESYSLWFRRTHVRFIMIVSGFLVLLSSSFIPLADFAGDPSSRPPLETAFLFTFRGLSTGSFVLVFLCSVWKVNGVRGKVLQDHYELLTWGLTAFGTLCICSRDVVDRVVSPIFASVAACAISATPSVRTLPRFYVQATSVVSYSVAGFISFENPGTAVKFMLVPLLILLAQVSIASMILDRDVRRHYVQCHSDIPDKRRTPRLTRMGSVGVDREVAGRAMRETLGSGELAVLPGDYTDEVHGDVHALARKFIRFVLFLSLPGRSVIKSELLFRNNAAKRDRALTRLALLAFATTSAAILFLELYASESEASYNIDLATLLGSRAFAILAPLVVSVLLSDRFLQSKFGELSSLRPQLPNRLCFLLGSFALTTFFFPGLYGAFDLLIFACMMINCATLVWFEHLVREQATERPDRNKRWDTLHSPAPAEHELYTVLLVKQLFVMVSSFRTPVVMSFLGTAVIVGVRVYLDPSTSNAHLLMVWFIAVAGTASRERLEKTTFLFELFRDREEPAAKSEPQRIPST
jgi:hypothetical protein